jgi:hypothetical protein
VLQNCGRSVNPPYVSEEIPHQRIAARAEDGVMWVVIPWWTGFSVSEALRLLLGMCLCFSTGLVAMRVIRKSKTTASESPRSKDSSTFEDADEPHLVGDPLPIGQFGMRPARGPR